MYTQTKIDPTSRNGFKTAARNLFNRYLVLPTENVAEFEEMFDALDADYRPVDAMERMYFELIVSAKWRLRRLQKFEAALYASLCGTSEKARSGFCLCKRGRSPFCGPKW